MEAPMEPWEPRWDAGGRNGTQEASMVLREPRWGPGGSNGAQEAPWVVRRYEMESRRLSCSLEEPDRADMMHIIWDMP